VDRKKIVGIIFLVLFLFPALLSGGNIIVRAQGGGGGSGGLSGFITTLQTALPVLLLLLAILANRYDQRYALTLFAASLIVAGALGILNINTQQYGVSIALVQLNVQVSGPTDLYLDPVTHTATATYYATWSPSMPASIDWLVYYNGSVILNQTTTLGQITITFTGTGKYIVVAIVSNQQNFAQGVGVLTVTVSNPPGILDWITNAITNAITGVINKLTAGFQALIYPLLQLFSTPLDWLLYSPAPSQTTQSYFSLVQKFSVGLALLFLAFSVAYNAFTGGYYDLVDLAQDIIYKLGVWGLFTSAGLTIYTYAANFINAIIYSVAGPNLGIASISLTSGTILYTALTGGLATIPFFANDIAYLISWLMIFIFLALAIATFRWSVMLAIVSLIPLLASLWIFEWTRKIAFMAINLLISMMLAGLILAFTLAILVSFGLTGTLMLFLLPVVLGIESISTIALLAFELSSGSGLVSKVHSKIQSQIEKSQH